MEDGKMGWSDQEVFWSGAFGDDYTDRNDSAALLAANTALFSQILKRLQRPGSILEFGANIGMNLEAIRSLLPHAKMAAVEINSKAAELLKSRLPFVEVHNTSITQFESFQSFDLVLFKGVLIHIAPDHLEDVLRKAYEITGRYLVVCEYYSPRYEMVSYRGHENKMYRGDFAAMAQELCPGLSLLDYGFVYHRDPHFPLDDISWFVLEKETS